LTMAILKSAVTGVVLLLLAACQGEDVIVRFKSSNAHPLLDHQGGNRHQLHLSLSQHAQASQAAARAILINAGAEHESFWIDNSIAIPAASEQLLQELRMLPEVAEVVTDSRVFLPEVVPELGASTPQGNIEALHAGELWSAGYTGQGVVVATIDSGVRWTHEALRANYRGFASGSGAVNHDYSFWTSKSVPLTPDTADIYGHGTHVTGTLAGSGPHSIGMAPNATWIHAKAFGWDGSASQSDLIAAAQWVLCPTKYDHSAPDCTKGAHVVSCSFGGNASMTWLNPAVKAMRAAGAFPVFASGNVNAFKCGSVVEPAGGPDAIAVGGVNSGELYPSSGKGPGIGGIVKPDFVAPSFAINSALSAADTGHDAYTRLTGTSMATPHVAGSIALLLSTGSEASKVQAALQSSAFQKLKRPFLAANNCGGTPYNTYPNNEYGWGLPDVCAAAIKLGKSCTPKRAPTQPN